MPPHAIQRRTSCSSHQTINQIRTLQALHETLGGPRLAMVVCNQHGTLH
ncbi:hypothetical protein [Aquitalea sp.]|nr:hypothetical protein [Aquitalea sp.]